MFLNSKHGKKGVKTAAEVTKLFDTIEPVGLTPIGKKLQGILPYQHWWSKEPKRKKLYLVVTDGRPSDEKGLKKAITRAATGYSWRSESYTTNCTVCGNHSVRKIGIQFVQIGDDKEATAYLVGLDDCLKLPIDIVDTTTASPEDGHLGGHLIKALVGAVIGYFDREEVAKQLEIYDTLDTDEMFFRREERCSSIRFVKRPELGGIRSFVLLWKKLHSTSKIESGLSFFVRILKYFGKTRGFSDKVPKYVLGVAYLKAEISIRLESTQLRTKSFQLIIVDRKPYTTERVLNSRPNSTLNACSNMELVTENTDGEIDRKELLQDVSESELGGRLKRVKQARDSSSSLSWWSCIRWAIQATECWLVSDPIRLNLGSTSGAGHSRSLASRPTAHPRKRSCTVKPMYASKPPLSGDMRELAMPWRNAPRDILGNILTHFHNIRRLNEQRWMSPQDVDEFKDEVENAQKKSKKKAPAAAPSPPASAPSATAPSEGIYPIVNCTSRELTVPNRFRGRYSKKSKTGAIVGALVGVIGGLTVLAAIILLLRRKRPTSAISEDSGPRVRRVRGNYVVQSFAESAPPPSQAPPASLDTIDAMTLATTAPVSRKTQPDRSMVSMGSNTSPVVTLPRDLDISALAPTVSTMTASAREQFLEDRIAIMEAQRLGIRGRVKAACVFGGYGMGEMALEVIYMLRALPCQAKLLASSGLGLGLEVSEAKAQGLSPSFKYTRMGFATTPSGSFGFGLRNVKTKPTQARVCKPSQTRNISMRSDIAGSKVIWTPASCSPRLQRYCHPFWTVFFQFPQLSASAAPTVPSSLSFPGLTLAFVVRTILSLPSVPSSSYAQPWFSTPALYLHRYLVNYAV
ncbi:hypothetical protein B0H14DRAFT_3576031 [Mycena olivaceomarginata]|nr:hypothetical protein B0H14DRAFT_3576031 [Mycena olivaceomarginata]